VIRLSARLAVLAVSTIAVSAYAPAVLAADQQVEYVSPDRNFSFVGGVGYAFLEGDELVYDEVGNRISHLIWETDAPVLTAKFKGNFKGNWTISGGATIGFSGDSHMEDYDWLAGDYASDNWTHRSIHPDTDLDRYLNLDIAAGYDFVLNEVATINLHGGFKYTNVKWSAYGGSYVYSVDGFRDSVGNFPDGERGITFEQRYPGLFLGAEASAKSGAWTFTGLLRGGFTINASDTDHHWMRDLRFEEEYDAIPFISLGAQVDYAVTERASIFLAGDYDHYFDKKGDTTLYDISTGAEGPTYQDGAGMEFSAFAISAGFKLNF
jgi:outer membrane protease